LWSVAEMWQGVRKDEDVVVKSTRGAKLC